MLGTVFGSCCSKANSRRIVRRGSFTAIIKSEKALVFEQAAIMQLKALKKGQETIDDDVSITCTIYYPTRRNDLDPSLFFDCLQKAEVIKNDRQLKEQHLYHGLDKENPRVEFRIDILA